jgi:hypothetical protein
VRDTVLLACSSGCGVLTIFPVVAFLCRWEALSAAGYAAPENVYVATNALYYKFFEFWSFGKGLAINHIVNSGRSLGDSRCVLLSGCFNLRASQSVGLSAPCACRRCVSN